MTEVRSRREYAWLSCRAKACCARGADVTDADIARIATGLALDPINVVATEPAVDGDPVAVALGPTRRVRLHLVTTTTGCVFLLRTRSGAGRCGLGDLAPAACRIFPADPCRPEPAVRPEPGCTCRRWTETDVADAPVVRANQELTAWRELIARWNAYAVEVAEGLELDDFLRYVLHVRAELDGGAAW